MMTVRANWTAHVRTGTETFCMMRNADVIIYTTEIILYIYVVCTSDITFHWNVTLHL